MMVGGLRRRRWVGGEGARAQPMRKRLGPTGAEVKLRFMAERRRHGAQGGGAADAAGGNRVVPAKEARGAAAQRGAGTTRRAEPRPYFGIMPGKT